MKYSQEVADYVPEGLSVTQYAVNIVEEVMSWPANRSNVELIAECLASIGKSKRLDSKTAYKYMVRAIRFAKEQDVELDYNFFARGIYTKMRPTAQVPTGKCSPECQAQHGRGYHANDVKWVMLHYFKEVKAGGNRTPEYFFKELDSKRAGGPPEWKR